MKVETAHMESSEDDMAQRKLIAEKDQWLDLRVFCMRLSSCPLENAPQFLTLRHIPTDFTAGLEVNGESIAASETASSFLRRDRVDKQSAEVIYVSTDSVRIGGSVIFEAYDKDVLLVSGKLQRLDNTLEWKMDCSAGLVGSLFLGGGKTERRSWGVPGPAMEVCVAGCCSGSPMFWTKKLQPVCGRKSLSGLCLDNIREDEKTMKLWKNREQSDRLFQLSNGSYTEEEDEMGGPGFNRFYPESGYIEEEDGELSWFNAGVGVGVGIGLGMFVGIGVGVGLLVNTYQLASKVFRRKWL